MFRKSISYLSVVALLVVAAPMLVHAQDGKLVDYCTACDLAQTLHNLLEFMIILGVIFSVLLFINAGVLYISSSTNPGNIARAHKIFLNTVIGLIIMLAAWLVIDVIMKTIYSGTWGGWNEIICNQATSGYDLNKGIVSCGGTTDCTVGVDDGCVPADAGPIDLAPTPVVTASGAGPSSGGTPDGSKVALNPNLPTKGAATCSGTNPCSVDASFAPELEAFAAELAADPSLGLGPGEWQITEAWPPAEYDPVNKPNGIHASKCHGDGTCVDINFTAKKSAATPERVKYVIETAQKTGNKAVYETNDIQQYNQLLKSGVPPQNLLYLQKITAPHFSLYGNQ